MSQPVYEPARVSAAAYVRDCDAPDCSNPGCQVCPAKRRYKRLRSRWLRELFNCDSVLKRLLSELYAEARRGNEVGVKKAWNDIVSYVGLKEHGDPGSLGELRIMAQWVPKCPEEDSPDKNGKKKKVRKHSLHRHAHTHTHGTPMCAHGAPACAHAPCCARALDLADCTHRLCFSTP